MARSSNRETKPARGRTAARGGLPVVTGAIGAGAPIEPVSPRRVFPVAQAVALDDAAGQTTLSGMDPAGASVPGDSPELDLATAGAELRDGSKRCSLKLPSGCYRLTVKPSSEFAEYRGTLRVDRAEGPLTVSGDLYRYAKRFGATPSGSVADAPATFASARADGVVGSLSRKPTIPIYPINRYYSYLNVTGVQLTSLVPAGGKCTASITAEEYFYTQPPAGSFNGTFPAAPGSRTVTLTFHQVKAPIGYAGPRFEGTLFIGGVDSGTVLLQWVSKYFRRCTVEIDTLTGAVSPQPVPAHPASRAAAEGKVNETFRTMLASAGWDARIVYDEVAVPVPVGVTPNACWSNSDLHALMASVRKPTTNLNTEWRLHCVVVPAAMGCSRGIMYDTIAVPREGVASFSDDGYPDSHSSNFGTAENQTQRDTPRAFMRSCSHEIVHGFNQIHQESEGGADNSIMTTTPSVADVLDDAASGDPGIFPDDIRLEVNDHVRHHLVHMPDICVRPGGLTFGSGHGGGFVPQADRYTFTARELLLTVEVLEPDADVGEPVRIRYVLANTGTEPLPVPAEIAIEATYTTITVIDPKGRAKEMPPYVIRCEAAGITMLAPGESLKAETRVFWSTEGFAFTGPGTHVIDVAVMWTADGVPCLVRGQATVAISAPLTALDGDAANTLLHPQIGMFVALGGGAMHLDEALTRLKAVSAARGDQDGRKVTAKALRGFDGLLPPSRIELDQPAGEAAREAPRRARATTSSTAGRRR